VVSCWYSVVSEWVLPFWYRAGKRALLPDGTGWIQGCEDELPQMTTVTGDIWRVSIYEQLFAVKKVDSFSHSLQV
jgi:hypothetical protein